MAKTLSEIEKLRREVNALKRRVAQLERQKGIRSTPTRTVKHTQKRSSQKKVMPDQNLRRHFGTLSAEQVGSLDNESIDRDLANEYANNHGAEV